MTTMQKLRWVAIAEATTFLMLLVASYVKHNDGTEAGVSIMGPIHGLLFLAYVGLTLAVRRDAGWSNGTTALVLLGAVLPFGGYVVDRRVLRPAVAAST